MESQAIDTLITSPLLFLFVDISKSHLAFTFVRGETETALHRLLLETDKDVWKMKRTRDSILLRARQTLSGRSGNL